MTYLLCGTTVILMLLTVVFSTHYTSLSVRAGLLFQKKQAEKETNLDKEEIMDIMQTERGSTVIHVLYHAFFFASVLIPAIYLPLFRANGMLYITFLLSMIALQFSKEDLSRSARLKQFALGAIEGIIPFIDEDSGKEVDMSPDQIQDMYEEIKFMAKKKLKSGIWLFVLALLNCPLLHICFLGKELFL